MYSTSSVSLRLEGTFGVASIGMDNFRGLRMWGLAHQFGEPSDVRKPAAITERNGINILNSVYF